MAQSPLPSSYGSGVKVNYVRTFDALAPITNPTDLLTRPVKDVRQTTQYLDGLGRPIQTVVKHGSLATGGSAKDLVTAQVYDEFGRETYQYLPFASDSSNGNFKLNPFQQQKDFYNSFLTGQPGETSVGGSALNWAYGKTMYEASPLNRVQSVYAPGAGWVGSEGGSAKRNISSHYWINKSADSVRNWQVLDTAGKLGGYTSAGIYPAGELYKNVTVDEHGKQVMEFKDKEGQVVLKKVQLTAAADTGTGKNHQGWLCTYYIYDDFNLLRAVIQPVAVERMATAGNWTLSAAELAEQVFRYAYDGRHRMSRKQVPGAGEVYLIYDKWDRLVLTQDANQRASNQYLYTKYDALNRPVMTGTYTHGTPLAQDTMQRYVYAQNLGRFETRHSSDPGYTLNGSFPVVLVASLLTATYYDDYGWLGAAGNPFSGTRYNGDDGLFLTASTTVYPYPEALTQSARTQGMVTGTRTRILGSASSLYGILYYDEKGRVIQTQTQNAASGQKVVTTQYSFSGQVLRSYDLESNGHAGPSQVHGLLTKYEYDDLGRLLTVKKELFTPSGVGNTGEKLLVSNEYDALGQLKKKKLSPSFNSNAGLESLSYDYNIRGWLLGVNRSYLPGSTSSYFGFELSYDKRKSAFDGQSADTYAAAQFNGNIGGMIWRSRGDGERRKYDFEYDAANRLLKGNFTQHNSGWNTSAGVDFSIGGNTATGSTLKYDANGNILELWQKGLKLGSSNWIDQLQYTYYEGSNRLKNVADLQNDATTTLGDFRTSSLHTASKTGATVDYTYDAKGNLKKDLNKDIGTASAEDIVYNHLNLPHTITVRKSGGLVKGTITYTYDAAGNKLKKEVAETGLSVQTTLYLGGAVYQNDTLQFIGHEEGRLRFVPGAGGSGHHFAFDYFLKDHLGNVRMVLTDALQTDVYPLASLEGNKAGDATTSIGRAKLFYDIDTTKIVNRSFATGIPNYENHNAPVITKQPSGDSAQNSQQLYKLMALSNTGVTGLGITLKVMSGDEVSVFGKSYYHEANTGGSNYDVPILDLLNGLIGSGAGASAKGVTGAALNGISSITDAVAAFRDDPTRDPSTSTIPRASLNWILFDEQFRPVSGAMGFNRVTTANTLEDLKELNIAIPKNGYLYVYCSNESPTAVFFDNVQVVHGRGQVLEETHYYPWGLAMAGISSKAAGGLDNDIKFNGKELNEDLDLDWYEYGFRNNFDPQLGRFHSVDPLASDYPYYTPYQFAGNQPTIAIDVDGLEPAFINDIMQWAATKVATNPNSNTSKSIGAVVGVGKSIEKTAIGVGNVIAHPINTLQEIASLNTPEGVANMAISVSGKVNAYQNGTGFDKSAIISEAVTDIATAFVGTKGIGAGVKSGGAAGEVAGIANSIPGQVARVVPNSVGKLTTLGRAEVSDVFVTASSDIKGLNATQIAQKLTIPESATGFKVVTFETPQGIASPIRRSTPGFVGGGRTAGGAREFVVPNQPIPQNAKIKTVN